MELHGDGEGNVHAGAGISCGDVTGDLSAGTHVSCGDVGGYGSQQGRWSGA